MITFTAARESAFVQSRGMKVGELAKRTGRSVLQQIKSLRQLGFSLDEIRDCLDSPEFSPRRTIINRAIRAL